MKQYREKESDKVVKAVRCISSTINEIHETFQFGKDIIIDDKQARKQNPTFTLFVGYTKYRIPYGDWIVIDNGKVTVVSNDDFVERYELADDVAR